jgi:hypothetical protein
MNDEDEDGIVVNWQRGWEDESGETAPDTWHDTPPSTGTWEDDDDD